MYSPLIFQEADERLSHKNKKITPIQILKYLSSETAIPSTEDIKKRYETIAENANIIFAVPMEFKILNKLIYPLKHAIGSYMMGNALETIALCGMVSEMAAVFLFEISKLRINDKPIKKIAKSMFNKEFEKLGQEQRIRFLHTLEIIDDEAKEQFVTVKNIRKQYLHFLSKEHEQINPDAKKVFDTTLKLIRWTLGITIVDGKITLSEDVLNYLKEKNLINK